MGAWPQWYCISNIFYQGSIIEFSIQCNFLTTVPSKSIFKIILCFFWSGWYHIYIFLQRVWIFYNILFVTFYYRRFLFASPLTNTYNVWLLLFPKNITRGKQNLLFMFINRNECKTNQTFFWKKHTHFGLNL